MSVRFQDAMTGQTVTSLLCGKPYTFIVDGYSEVRLYLTKDNDVIYNDAFTVPMPDYISSCAVDPGHYEAIAFDLNDGSEIGKANIDILPDPNYQPPIFGGIFDNIPTPVLIGGALVLLYVFSKKGKA